MAKPKSNDTEISILELTQGEIHVNVLGTSPLIYNAMSQKVIRELLMPSGKKNAAEKAANLKHNPIEEYRNSVYHHADTTGPTSVARHADTTRPTYLSAPAVWFKKAMAGAALDIPGAAKAQIGRLVWTVGDCGDRVDMYGVPKLSCMVVRSADMNHTPDVRTRAILPEWACRLRIRFMKPILKDPQILNLLAAGGVTNGVGDGRQQKGSLSYGQFRLVGEDNPDFIRICKEGGRAVQVAAMNDPEFYDEETARLIAWFDSEVERRGHSRSNGKSNGRIVEAQS